jgi:DNA repair exonuclease SbcCD ATPase subunit
MSKEYYTNFKTIVSDLNSQAKGLRGDISTYKQNIDQSKNTVDIENKLKKDLKSFKDSLDKLEEAYLTRNIPGNMPEATLDQRQKEIKKIKIDYEEINKQFQELNSNKYSFKGQITEDYRNKEELKGLTTGELLQLQDNKLKEQDNQIDDIITDGKKGTVLADNLQHGLKDQSKKAEQVMEDMDMVDSRMKKLTKRFNNYVKNSSYCCLCSFFFLQAVIFGVLVWVYADVLKDY